jgi:hypothetical protein
LTVACSDESAKSGIKAGLTAAYMDMCEKDKDCSSSTSSSEDEEKGGFSTSIKNKNSFKFNKENITVEVYAIGHEKGTQIVADTLEEAIDLHRNFTSSIVGTGTSVVL